MHCATNQKWTGVKFDALVDYMYTRCTGGSDNGAAVTHIDAVISAATGVTICDRRKNAVTL